MSWFGGFAGGLGVGVAVLLHRRLPIIPVFAAATPGVAFGQLIGRIGCFLVGDDYGRPAIYRKWSDEVGRSYTISATGCS